MVAGGTLAGRGVRLLAIGDVHLGTRPSRIPAILGDQVAGGLESLTPAAALKLTVDLALEEAVDAVLFAGDVVESANARFEALPALESSVRRLVEAGIPVLGVAGNHDVEALPRLADMIAGFKLLGRGGRWESSLLPPSGEPAVEIVGWSFPDQRVTVSPIRALLDAPLISAAPRVPRIGLLHGDLDASGGSYAPFSRRELEDAGLDAWLLGHIHIPSLTSGMMPHGYLGSLVGLDPSETGAHGPWMVHVDGSGKIVPDQLPLAPLRWERFDLEVAEDQDPEDLADRLGEEAERFAAKLVEDGSKHRVLGLRIRLVGSTRSAQALRDSVAREPWRNILRSVSGTVVFIDKVQDQLEVAADLQALAKGQDPPGLLARTLLTLEVPGEGRRELLGAAREALGDLARDPRWSPVSEMRGATDPLSDDALVTCLRQSGMRALQQLLDQRSQDPSAEEKHP